MKTNTTYPTKHPHWIDEPEYLDAIKKRKRIGISFTTAFILVLAIHLAGVGGIFAFSNLRSDKKPTSVVEAPVEKQPGPKSDSLARNEWPQPDAQPKAVATPPPVKKQVAAPRLCQKPRQSPLQSSRPSQKKRRSSLRLPKPRRNLRPPQPRLMIPPRGKPSLPHVQIPNLSLKPSKPSQLLLKLSQSLLLIPR